jgi:16S rRNA (uracil1498-N3)-methyltransferase
VPGLEHFLTAEKAFAAAGARDELRVLLSERVDAAALRDVLRGSASKSVAMAVGPEGGWTDAEFDAARAGGFVEASLGHLILRTETAVAAGLASVNFALGD